MALKYFICFSLLFVGGLSLVSANSFAVTENQSIESVGTSIQHHPIFHTNELEFKSAHSASYIRDFGYDATELELDEDKVVKKKPGFQKNNFLPSLDINHRPFLIDAQAPVKCNDEIAHYNATPACRRHLLLRVFRI
ncbi:hypothetical protein [Crocinitomix catalasitica]|uniref:hypothetical protein n=1 Tax=Crocinitomix catalasitica TaxID=184607 RepID=UPI0012FBA4FA|nr:hypothetical protein [Crocinitomix catalasitica]